MSLHNGARPIVDSGEVPALAWRPDSWVAGGSAVVVVPGAGVAGPELVNAARGLAPRAMVLAATLSEVAAVAATDRDVAGDEIQGAAAPDVRARHAGDAKGHRLARATSLAAVWRQTLADHGAHGRRSFAVGHGWHGGLLLDVLAARPRPLWGAVLFLPEPVPVLETSMPAAVRTAIDLDGLRLFVGARRAEAAADGYLVQLARTWQDAGAAVTLRWRDRGGVLTDAELQAARTWLRLSGLDLLK